MTLEAGTRLGAYVILSPLGAGGMGEVYRAEDTKLKREVAIKVLPDHFAADEGRMKRFDREAQVLASLNHPHIAAIYGREEEAGVHAIVLELVEGPTLAEKIEQGGMALSEALDIAKQIAEALESAHEQGIVHRDLKPPNVKVRDDGTVKVLDYGLAKALERDVPEEDQEDSPTRLRQGFGEASSATLAGVIWGTAAYMSPEQARGGRVDRRSDIWSFGVVLWEMLTGERLFTGETASDVLAQVLTKEPDWTSLPAGTPAPIRRLLERCLCKEKWHRLAGISAALFAIDESQSGGETVAARERIPWRYVAAALGVALVVSILGSLLSPSSVERTPTRLHVEISPDAPLALNFGGSPTLSPDGKHLVYVTHDGIQLRMLDRWAAETLARGSRPFFSADGQWVGFYQGSSLKKVSISGGAPVTLCESCPTTNSRSPGTWSSDDTVVFARPSLGALYRIPPNGGEPERLVMVPEDETIRHIEPYFLPGGEALLMTARLSDSLSETNIEVLDLRSGERKLVHRGGRSPKYLPTGHVAFVHEGTLFAAPFDLSRLELSGPPVSLVDGIASSRFGHAHYSISETGVLVYVPERQARHMATLAWVARDGTVSPLSIPPGNYVQPELSPDGTKLALEHVGDADIWLHDLTRGGRSRLTFHEARDWTPA